MTSLADLCVQTKKEFSNIVRPLSAYQYYTKAMLEKWADMSNDEKRVYIAQATNDHTRYEREKETIREKSEEEVKKHNIFLTRSYGRVPCVGLDNGFTSYEVCGPVKKVKLFTEEEKQKLVEKGISEKNIGKYKSIGWLKFNWRAAKKFGVSVYGGNTNNSDSWWGVRENYEGKTGQFTSYNNYKGETWTVEH
jgi:hypothetical protein